MASSWDLYVAGSFAALILFFIAFAIVLYRRAKRLGLSVWDYRPAAENRRKREEDRRWK